MGACPATGARARDAARTSAGEDAAALLDFLAEARIEAVVTGEPAELPHVERDGIWALNRPATYMSDFH